MASASPPTSELATQSPAPASSPVEPPPARKPPTGAVDLSAGAAIREDPEFAAAAAAAASTTALRLFTLGHISYRHHMIILIGYSTCTNVVHGFLLHCNVVSLLLYPARRVCGLVFGRGLGWMAIYQLALGCESN